MTHEGQPQEPKIEIDGTDEYGPMPTVRVLRSSGVHENGWLKGATFIDEETGKSLTAVMKPNSKGNGLLRKRVPTEDLQSWQLPQSDEDVAKIQTAEVGPNDQERETRIAELSQRLIGLEKNLSDEDKLQLSNYSRDLLDKQAAQKRNDGQASYAHESNAGHALNAMTKNAQKVSNEYSKVMADIYRLRG